MNMSPVVHFELPADDKKRMAEFYTKVFGWKMNFMGPDMSEYVVVETTETGANSRPTQPGAINGGIFQRTTDPKTQVPSVVISVDDIHQAMKELEAAGGKVLSGPDDIPGIGLYASFLDTENNRMTMLQPSSEMK